MGFSTAIFTCFRKYFTITGRAPRSEYWWWVLFFIVGGAMATAADVVMLLGQGGLTPETMMTGSFGLVSGFFWLATLIPNFSVTVRRLHDTGRTGGWVLVPYVLIGVSIWGLLMMSSSQMAEFGLGDVGGDPLIGGILVGVSNLAMLVVSVLMLIWMILPGTRGENYFGPDPLGTWSPLHGYDTVTVNIGPGAIPRA